MDHMAILAKTQKRHEGKSERGGVATTPPPLLRERVKLVLARGVLKSIAQRKVLSSKTLAKAHKV